MKISLVIASHNRAGFLREALDRLPLRSMERHAAELILVDSGSSDDTFEVMNTFAQPLPVAAKVLMASEKTLSVAHNAAATVATGDLIAFTDDDCYLEEDYFDVLRREFDPHQHHYGSGQILLYDAADDPRVASTNWPQGMRQVIKPGTFLPTGLVQGANMFVLRDVFLGLGGFNEDLGPGSRFRSGADIDLAARASEAGFTGIILANARVHHHHRRRRGSPESEEVLRRYDYGRGVYYAGLIARGDQRVWEHWHRQSETAGHSPRVLERLTRELQGAADYLGQATAREHRSNPSNRSPEASGIRSSRAEGNQLETAESRAPRAEADSVPVMPSAAGPGTLMRTQSRVKTRSGSWIYVDPLDQRGRQLCTRNGDLNPPSLAIWHHLLRENAWTHIIDVGANYGEMLVNGCLSQDAHIIAVEPNPCIRPYLAQTLKEAGISAEVLGFAISDFTGTAELLLDQTWSGTTRLAKSNDGSAENCRERVSVPATTLSALLTAGGDIAHARALVKIDVEGHEIPVLRGAFDALRHLEAFSALVEILHLAPNELAWIIDRFDVEVFDHKANKLEPVLPATVDQLTALLKHSRIYKQDVVLRRKAESFSDEALV